MKTLRAGMAAAVAATLLAACGTSGSGAGAAPIASGPPSVALGGADIADQMAALYTQAKAGNQTQVVVYGPGQSYYASAYAAFSARYPGIKVVPQEIFGAQLNTRLDQEFTSGKHVGSLLAVGAPVVNQAAKTGRCESYQPFAASYLTSDQKSADDTYHAYVQFAFGIGYNSDKVTTADAPTGWSALTDPKWKDQVVTPDMTTVGASSNTMSQLFGQGLLNQQWLTSLIGNGLQSVASTALADQEVARGQRSILLVTYSTVYVADRKKNFPVRFVFPASEGARMESQYTCLLKGAPNDAATKLFLNWLYTPEGQAAFATTGAYGTRPGTPAPPYLPSIDTFKDKIIKPLPIGEQAAKSQAFAATAKQAGA